jgi:hypothetical protein
MLIKDVLYIGSGNSALQAKEIVTTDLTICAVNNAWQILEKVDYWIHSGDFPKENYPKNKNYKNKISHGEYAPAVHNLSKTLGWNVTSPEHYVGYTIFFQGLYWIMAELKPKNIYTLGFDHDYNKEKLKKWFELKEPSPHNKYNGLVIDEEFADFKNDSFYGVSTPDPMRLGQDHIEKKFELAKQCAEKLDIKLWNISSSKNTINSFNKKEGIC